MCIRDSGKVERRQITTDRAIDSAWLVTSGLVAGEQVIIEGLQKARPGAQVRTVPFAPPAVASAGSATGSATGGSASPPAPASSGSGSAAGSAK